MKNKRNKKGDYDMKELTDRVFYDPTNVLEALVLMNKNTGKQQVDQMFNHETIKAIWRYTVSYINVKKVSLETLIMKKDLKTK